MMTRAIAPTTGPAIHDSLFLDDVELVGEVDDTCKNVVVAYKVDEEVAEVKDRSPPWSPRQLTISFQSSKEFLVGHTG